VDELLVQQSHSIDSQDDAEDDERDERRSTQADADDLDEPAQPASLQSEHSDGEEEDEVVVLRDPKREEIDLEAQAEFDREFAKMLVDNSEARRDRKTAPPVFDSAVPMVKRRTEEQSISEGKMAFTLLTKRGNRQQLRSLEIPAESAIAINSRSYQERNKAEQEQLKRLVLQNERRLEQSEIQSFVQDARDRGIKLRFAKP